MPIHRRPLVAANWKMHGQTDSSTLLLNTLKQTLADVSCKVLICPPALYIPLAREILEGSEISVGAQNVYSEEQGAFTGEISASMAADSGCDHVLVGHSERRQLFGETDDLVARKFAAIQAQGLTPVLCVGETLEQREQGETASVVLGQLEAVVARTGTGAFANAVVAYEPVWAIGTGVTATPEQAQEVHAILRQYFSDKDAGIAGQLLLLYGGSVKAANAAELFAQPDIDGGLVGGASLDAEEFTLICRAAAQ